MTSTSVNPLGRFSDRVNDYVKYRPVYPKALLDFLRQEFRIGSTTQIADVGSGTGIFSRQLLELGASVFAVEPNAEMRLAAEQLLGGNSKFTSIPAPAESTGLPSHSVDIVTAAQAFHWFDSRRAKIEWRRILKPKGIVVLIWNDRKDKGSEFLTSYEELLIIFGTDYNEVKHRYTEENGSIDAFFSPYSHKVFSCANEQKFDFEGLRGRLLSSSYAPAVGHPKHEPMIEALRQLFSKYQVGGHVKFEYDTKAFYGEVPPGVD